MNLGGTMKSFVIALGTMLLLTGCNSLPQDDDQIKAKLQQQIAEARAKRPVEVTVSSTTATDTATETATESSKPDPDDLTDSDKAHLRAICEAHDRTYDGWEYSHDTDPDDQDYVFGCRVRK